MQIYYNKLVIANENKRSVKSIKQIEQFSQLQLSKKFTFGVSSRRNLKERISTFLIMNYHGGNPDHKNLIFITLTLPSKQAHPDKILYDKALRPFLRWLQLQGATKYLWKAEKQENGNTHYHIIADKYIENRPKWFDNRNKQSAYNEANRVEPGAINKAWNRILKRIGYIEPYKKDAIKREKALLMRNSITQDQRRAIKYAKLTKYEQPNSTDVRGVKQNKVKNVVAYLAKYISKKETNKQNVDGRTWGCSDNVTKFPPIKIQGYLQKEKVIKAIKNAKVKYEKIYIVEGGKVMKAVDYEKMRELQKPKTFATIYTFPPGSVPWWQNCIFPHIKPYMEDTHLTNKNKNINIVPSVDVPRGTYVSGSIIL